MGTESRPPADQEREALLARTHPSPRAELPGRTQALFSGGGTWGLLSPCLAAPLSALSRYLLRLAEGCFGTDSVAPE